jgi:hypothetical protein
MTIFSPDLRPFSTKTTLVLLYVRLMRAKTTLMLLLSSFEQGDRPIVSINIGV